jgi:hypothetical protein
MLDSPEPTPELIFVQPYKQSKITKSKSAASATTYQETARTVSHRNELKEFTINDD